MRGSRELESLRSMRTVLILVIAALIITAIIILVASTASKIVTSSRSNMPVGAQVEHGPAVVVSPSSRAVASMKDQSRLPQGDR